MEKNTFCPICRKTVTYTVTTKEKERVMGNNKYPFIEREANCNDCGSYLFIDEIVDDNEIRFDEAYRKLNNIITIAEIQSLLTKLNTDALSLSKQLGFEENAISEYLGGRLPNSECSNILKELNFK